MGNSSKQQQNMPSVTAEQKFIFEKFSKMVGKVLTTVEAAIPAGSQLHSVRKMTQEAMYECRNEVLQYFTGYAYTEEEQAQ